MINGDLVIVKFLKWLKWFVNVVCWTTVTVSPNTVFIKDITDSSFDKIVCSCKTFKINLDLFWLLKLAKAVQTKSMFSWYIHLHTSCNWAWTGSNQFGLKEKNLDLPIIWLGYESINFEYKLLMSSSKRCFLILTCYLLLLLSLEDRINIILVESFHKINSIFWECICWIVIL